EWRRSLDGFCREGGRQCSGGKRNVATGEERSQFLDRAGHAFLGCLLTAAECLTYFPQLALLEEAQQDGVAICLAKLGDGFIEDRGDVVPCCGGLGREGFHLSEILFSAPAALLATDRPRGGEARRAKQPAGHDRA